MKNFNYTKWLLGGGMILVGFITHLWLLWFIGLFTFIRQEKKENGDAD